MSSFQSPLLLEYLDGRQFKLVAGFVYVTELLRDGAVYVPAGFSTDFASIPRGLWNVLPPTGRYGKAAVVHDFLYRCSDVDRATCDKVFLEAMQVLGVGWFTRRAMYLAVRAFGWHARTRMDTIPA
jgi:hypothetical protein